MLVVSELKFFGSEGVVGVDFVFGNVVFELGYVLC